MSDGVRNVGRSSHNVKGPRQQSNQYKHGNETTQPRIGHRRHGLLGGNPWTRHMVAVMRWLLLWADLIGAVEPACPPNGVTGNSFTGCHKSFPSRLLHLHVSVVVLSRHTKPTSPYCQSAGAKTTDEPLEQRPLTPDPRTSCSLVHSRCRLSKQTQVGNTFNASLPFRRLVGLFEKVIIAFQKTQSRPSSDLVVSNLKVFFPPIGIKVLWKSTLFLIITVPKQQDSCVIGMRVGYWQCHVLQVCFVFL